MTNDRPVAQRPADDPGPRSSRWLIVLVAVAVALRIGVQMVRTEDLGTDPDAYIEHSVAILETGTFSVPGTTRPTAFRPPVYPVLLASLQILGLSSELSVALVNLMASIAIVVSTWWLARVVGLRGHWPTICGGLTVLDPLLLRYVALPMTELVAGAFLGVAVLQCAKSTSKETSAAGKWKSALTSGLCFGVGGLCRPILFVACAAISLGLFAHWIVNRKRHSGSFVSHFAPVVLPALAAGLVLTLWVARNAMQFGQFIPATTHGGYTLLLGNNPVFYSEVVNSSNDIWKGPSLELWQRETQERLVSLGVNLTDERAVDRALYQMAADNIRKHPTGFLKACMLRWQRFWAMRPQTHSNDSIGIAGWFTSAWYVVVFVGLFAGVCTMVIRRDLQLMLLFLPILAFFAMHTVYWTNARMRAPLTALISVLAIRGWAWLVTMRTGRSSESRPTTGPTIQNHSSPGQHT